MPKNQSVSDIISVCCPVAHKSRRNINAIRLSEKMTKKPGFNHKHHKPTEMQHQFVREYLQNGQNGIAAYRVVYSAATLTRAKIAVRVHNILAKPAVRALLNQAADILAPEIASRLPIGPADGGAQTSKAIGRYVQSKDRLGYELATLAYASMKDYVRLDENGQPRLEFRELTDEQWGAIREIKVVETTTGKGDNRTTVKTVTLKLYDKRASLVDVAKLAGFMPRDMIDKGPVTDKDQLTDEAKREARQRLLRELAELAQTPTLLEAKAEPEKDS